MKNLRLTLLIAMAVIVSSLSCRLASRTSETQRVETPDRTASRSNIEPQSHVPLPLAIEQTSSEIQELNSELTDEIISMDEGAIGASLPYIKEEFIKKGFTSEDALEATMEGWKELRAGKKALASSEHLTPSRIIRHVGNYGKLVVKSIPDGAYVDLGPDRLPNTTEAKAWVSPGAYHMRISKQGYVTIEERCVIHEGRKTEVIKQLQPLPQ